MSSGERTVRNQDLRLARHSVPSNLDLAISLLQTVRGTSDLEPGERDAAAQVLTGLEAIHAADGLGPEERAERLTPVARDLAALDDAVNGPLPSGADE
jgi:hypothetical protein